MIFDTKKYVPLIYRSSRDYEALLKILDIVLTTVKYETDTLINLYIPENCPEEFLASLAEHIGYKYNYTDTVKENRIIIDNFGKMMKNKGSMIGIKLASALSLNSVGDEQQIRDLADLEVFFDYDKGQIIILYPNEDTKVRNLIDWVRPVGMMCTSIPMDKAKIKDAVKISDKVNVITLAYNDKRFASIDNSEIFDGLVAKYEPEISLSDINITLTLGNGTFNDTGLNTKIIETKEEEYITLPTNDDVFNGTNYLDKWKVSNVSSVMQYNPGEEIQVIFDSDATIEAVWKPLNYHSFKFNQNTIDTPLDSINIQPMFLNTDWIVVINYFDENDNVWINELSERFSKEALALNYPLHHQDKVYEIKIAYYDLSDPVSQINYESFTNDIYNIATIIDWSDLTDITTDIFINNTVDNIIVANEQLTELFMFPNIEELTVPNNFIAACFNLRNVTFPNVNCKLKFTSNSSTSFLNSAGERCSTPIDTFTIPSNIEIIFTDYNPNDYYTYDSTTQQYVISNEIEIFNHLNLGINQNIDCNVFPGDGSNIYIGEEPPIVMELEPHSDIELSSTININGKMLLAGLSKCPSYVNIILSKNVCLNKYNTPVFSENYDLSSCDTLTVHTDDYGTTTSIPNDFLHYHDNSSLYNSIRIIDMSNANAITEIGNYFASNNSSLIAVYLPNNLTEIKANNLQYNRNLHTIDFGNSTSIIIRGFHKCEQLTQIVIPAGCSYLEQCFFDCENLFSVNFSNLRNFDPETIFVSDTNIDYISATSAYYTIVNNVLYTKTFEYLIWVPWGITDVSTSDFTTNIGDYAFSGCRGARINPYVINLENSDDDYINYYNTVTLGENVTAIGKNAFMLTNIQELKILNFELDLTNLNYYDSNNVPNNTYNPIINKICGYIGSTAHRYATAHNITFESIGNVADNVNAIINDDNIGSSVLN